MTVVVWSNNYGEWMHVYREKHNNDLVIIHGMETFSAFHCSLYMCVQLFLQQSSMFWTFENGPKFVCKHIENYAEAVTHVTYIP